MSKREVIPKNSTYMILDRKLTDLNTPEDFKRLKEQFLKK